MLPNGHSAETRGVQILRVDTTPVRRPAEVVGGLWTAALSVEPTT